MTAQRVLDQAFTDVFRGLESALEDDGFKVVVPPQGGKDEALKRLARGWAILTKNSHDFTEDAVRHDYDVIGIEDVKFIEPGRVKIISALTFDERFWRSSDMP